MTEIQNNKKYDLEDRTLVFARDIINLVNPVPNSIANAEIVKQLVRSASSIGANYIEANGALGKKDFQMRIRICRKETKETRFWLKLLTFTSPECESQRQKLIGETDELLRIFNAILLKVT